MKKFLVLIAIMASNINYTHALTREDPIQSATREDQVPFDGPYLGLCTLQNAQNAIAQCQQSGLRNCEQWICQECGGRWGAQYVGPTRPGRPRFIESNHPYPYCSLFVTL